MIFSKVSLYGTHDVELNKYMMITLKNNDERVDIIRQVVPKFA